MSNHLAINTLNSAKTICGSGGESKLIQMADGHEHVPYFLGVEDLGKMQMRKFAAIQHFNNHVAHSSSTKDLFVHSSEQFWWDICKRLEVIAIWGNMASNAGVVKLHVP